MNRYWYLKWIALGIATAAAVSKVAQAVPLDSWPTWSTAQPYVSKQVPPGAMIVRGTGTNAYYVLEANPTTGALPVDIGGGSLTVDFSGPTDDPVPVAAAYMGGIDGSGDLQGVKVDTAGELQVDVLSSALPTGAATSDNQVTEITHLATLANGIGALPAGPAPMADSVPVVIATNQTDIPITSSSLTSIDSKTPALGQTTMASSSPVAIASNQSAIPVSQSGTWTVVASSLPTTTSTNAGAADSSTLRVSPASRVYSDSVRNDYGSVNVTTGAWVQLIASTAAAMNQVCITDQGGQVMELGTGAPAAETRVFLIAKGWSGCIPLRIAASTRIAIKAVSATASSGDFVLSGMN